MGKSDSFTRIFLGLDLQVYQLNAHTIRVLDQSKLQAKPFSSQPDGFDCKVTQSKPQASDAMAGVQLVGKIERQRELDWRLEKRQIAWIGR